MNYLIVIGALIFALVLTMRVAQGSAAEPPLDEEAEAAASSDAVYVVQPGDTLWGVATELVPDEDPRPVVDQLIDLNGSASIAVGQRITLPSGLTVNP